MGNSQGIIEYGSCGIFDTRKGEQTFKNDQNKYQRKMDNAMYIDSLSEDDN